MTEKSIVLVFLGGLGHGPAESIVGTARWAASLDSIESALGSGVFGGAVLVTDRETPPPDIPGVEVDAAGPPFHFGQRLAEVIQRRAPASVVYMGGGSMPLLPANGFVTVAEGLARGVGVTNNPYSSDLVAFPVSQAALNAVRQVSRDNALARALSEETGLVIETLSRRPETQFDIDSPTELAVLTLTGLGDTRLRTYLEAVELDVGRYRQLLPTFVDTAAELVVAGRVGSHAWAYLERETACRVRLFAEERGMEAEGRAEAGTVRSLLGFYLDVTGVKHFFETLDELGDAAIIDSRVLLAHKRVHATREDRFLSDLGRWREISDPFLREFTREALEAPIPVLLGGHSLMSGGLMLLNEHAWGERDAGRL